LATHPAISASIACEFLDPVLAIFLWDSRQLAAMLMPETAMNEDRLPSTRQDDIWRAGQARIIYSKAESQVQKHRAHSLLRSGVDLLEPAHN
jgi:hypothetical protein